MECVKCKQSDELYTDKHGTFCRRCGPSVPVESTTNYFEPQVVEASTNECYCGRLIQPDQDACPSCEFLDQD